MDIFHTIMAVLLIFALVGLAGIVMAEIENREDQ